MKVLEGQSLFDVAVQITGSIEGVFTIASENDISVTENIMPGSNITPSVIVNKEIVDYYSTKNLKPATGLNLSEEDSLTGIGSMTIEENFIIS